MYKEFEVEEDVVLGNFIAYMKIALRHKKINYLKYQKYVESKETKLNNEEWEVLCTIDNAEHSFFVFDYERIQETFENDDVSQAFEKLTNQQRKVLYLNYIEEIPISKIADILKISTNSVQRIRLRATISLKKFLEEIKNDRKN